MKTKNYQINEENLKTVSSLITKIINYNNKVNSMEFELKSTELHYLSMNQLMISKNYQYTQIEFNKLCGNVLRLKTKINKNINKKK